MILEDYGSFELIRSETFSCKVKKKTLHLNISNIPMIAYRLHYLARI